MALYNVVSSPAAVALGDHGVTRLRTLPMVPVSPSIVTTTRSSSRSITLGSAIVARAGRSHEGFELERVRDSDLEFSLPIVPPATVSLLYIGNLSRSVSSDQLMEIFEHTGNVEWAKVIYDRETGRSKGLAFVAMSNVEDARNAISMLDGFDLDGRAVKVSFPSPLDMETGILEGIDIDWGDPAAFASSPPGAETKLYVGNLARSVRSQTLADFFHDVGNVDTKYVRVVSDTDTSISMGFALVTMSTEEQAQRAICLLDGSDLKGRLLKVSFANEVEYEQGLFQLLKCEDDFIRGQDVLDPVLPPADFAFGMRGFPEDYPPPVHSPATFLEPKPVATREKVISSVALDLQSERAAILKERMKKRDTSPVAGMSWLSCIQWVFFLIVGVMVGRVVNF